jgi:predicted PurR-regulated permease PerM
MIAPDVKAGPKLVRGILGAQRSGPSRISMTVSGGRLPRFVVFLAILFWTWMWGAVGAMLALPLSLIVMTIIDELFIEEKLQPQLPK